MKHQIDPYYHGYVTPAYHTYSIFKSYADLRSAPSGLTKEVAEKRLEQYGSNTVPSEKSDGAVTILIRQLKNPLFLLLFFSAGLSLYLGDLPDAAIIFCVVLMDVTVGFFQEYRATKSIGLLLTNLSPKTIVLRGGERATIDSRDLVPGDIVLLDAGTKVPADLRLTQSYDLAIDESLLTGESVPVDKVTDQIGELDLPLPDQTNMAFSGTVVVRGNGRGIVVATGLATALGAITEEASKGIFEEMPITKQFGRFAKKIGLLVIVCAVIVFLLGLFSGYALIEIFKDVVAVSVAAIPEGLPLVVTAALSVAVQKMAKKQAIIRQLPAAETLGETTVICSDKTGTLTKNEMTVKKIYDGAAMYDVTGDGFSVRGGIFQGDASVKEAMPDALRFLLTVGLLCNDSGISVSRGDVEVHGDPTEIAIIIAAAKAGLLKEEERRHLPKRAVLPFDAKRGFMATLHKTEGKRYIFMKGAPEKVIPLCQSENSAAMGRAEALAREGLRVLAFAYKETEDLDRLEEHDIVSDFQFLGLVAMIDPPRENIREAVAACHHAGIRVIMLTGDHALTAGAIAKELGITEEAHQVITGYELAKMTDEELSGAATQVNVFARISPDQKLRIVTALKERGEIVAVTGDGVNDAPALKVAHIGVAMGLRGTDVAREVSDMVILDDNFATIVKAIEEARVLFENIRKATLFLIPTGFAAIITVLVTMILQLPLPFTAVQLLWINLVTNGLQDVALAFEPPERGVLAQKPRKQSDGIMSPLMYERSILVGVTIAAGVLMVYFWALREGLSLPVTQTLATTTMVLFQFFQVWNSRSETHSIFRINVFSNTMLFVSMVMAIIAHGLALYFLPLQYLLKTTYISASHLGVSVLVASSVLLVVEADKILRRKHRQERVGSS